MKYCDTGVVNNFFRDYGIKVLNKFNCKVYIKVYITNNLITIYVPNPFRYHYKIETTNPMDDASHLYGILRLNDIIVYIEYKN